MPEIHASLKDPHRQHIVWYRRRGKVFDMLTVSYVCGDFTLELYISTEVPDLSVRATSAIKAIFRNPGNGGGNMLYGFRAVGTLFRALKDATAEHQLSLFHQPNVTAPRQSVRHLDQGIGHIMLMEEPDCIAVIIIPHEKKHLMMNHGESVCAVFHRTDTPPAVYTALQQLLEGIDEDNLKRPNFYGNHA